ncbi:MAG: DNA polymerase Y family protein, partial [Pirellulales bacterium]|nr:DNA polymerase Y family protein [Pirellulales bacterium]
RRLGIETIGQLLKLPRSGLAARLGEALPRRIQQAMGEVDEPLAVYRQTVNHSHTRELEYPTDDLAIVANRITQLLGRTKQGLASSGRGVLRLTCQLDFADLPSLRLDVGLFAPTLDVEHLANLTIHQVESQSLAAAVTRLTIAVTLTGPLRRSQVSLFDDPLWQTDASGHGLHGQTLGRLVDSLSGRLGRDAVLGVTVEEDPLPENAFRVWPLTGNQAPTAKHVRARSRNRNNPAASSVAGDIRQVFPVYGPSPHDAMRRPLSLFKQPIPLDLELPSDRTGHHPPARFHVDGILHRVIRYWGPERIETGWWKGRSIRRDYYRIETDRGLWWWIFRNLVAEQASSTADHRCRWMLHGHFA